MNDLNFSGPIADLRMPSESCRDGETKGKEHCGRGHYMPDRNPYHPGSPPYAEWATGYERGWEDAFLAKVQQRRERQPQLKFSNQQR